MVRRIDTDVWIQKGMSLISEVLNLKPGFTPGINFTFSTCSQEVSLNTGAFTTVIRSCTGTHCADGHIQLTVKLKHRSRFYFGN